MEMDDEREREMNGKPDCLPLGKEFLTVVFCTSSRRLSRSSRVEEMKKKDGQLRDGKQSSNCECMYCERNI